MDLILNKKTGFVNLTPGTDILINDGWGVEFYNTSQLKKPVERFNLPIGEYKVIKGNIKKRKSPVNYKLPDLPPPQRKLRPPFDYKIEFGTNPNKCTIFWVEGRILFDSEFKTYPLPQLYFILFHEYGHSLYLDEHLADLCSARLMLIRGFNPSQIGNAPINSLSSYQYYRKKFIVDQLLKK